MAGKKAFQNTEVDETTVDLTKGIFRGSKNDGSGSWFIKLTNLFKLLLRSDGSITGATGFPQELTQGWANTTGNKGSMGTNAFVRSYDNDNETESSIHRDGYVEAKSSTNSTFSRIRSDGSMIRISKVSGLTSVVEVYDVKKTLTAAQVKTLNSVPVEIIPSPGAGKIVIPVSGMVGLNFNTMPFDNSLIRIVAGGTAESRYLLTSSTVLGGGSVLYKKLFDQDTSSSESSTALANTAINITADADASVGDSTVDVYLTYQIWTL